MANIFNTIPIKPPKRNRFNLSHQNKLTGEMGYLMPIFCEPVIPGDRFKIASQQLVRFAPLIAPIMADIDVYTHFFFVPNRIIWDNWETFITGAKNGRKLDADSLPLYPKLKIAMRYAQTGFGNSNGKGVLSNGSLADYLDFQTWSQKQQTEQEINDNDYYVMDEMPFRAYQRCFYDYYRDENLTDYLQEDGFDFISSKDGVTILDNSNTQPDALKRVQTLLRLQKRAWKKDYFTSALPWPQKGEDVTLPFGDNLIKSSGLMDDGLRLEDITGQGDFQNRGNQTMLNDNFPFFTESQNVTPGSTADLYMNTQGANPAILGINYNKFGLYPDEIAKALVTNGVAVPTINELRRAFAAQKFLERRAVGGSRYIEQNLAMFGVKSSDARLQRSEFLGGSKQPVVVSQVLQTSQTTKGETDGSPLGQPAGNAVSVGGKYIFDRFFEEYGFVVGIMSIIPRAEYKDGIPKKYLKDDPLDYYWPQFAHIGEQPIETQELFYKPAQNDTDAEALQKSTFGYTPRYAEYRFLNNRVHGDFKDTLSYWTLVRDFNGNIPQLNQSFIECNPSTRIFAYEDADFNHLWIQCNLQISSLRPLPKYGEAL